MYFFSFICCMLISLSALNADNENNSYPYGYPETNRENF